MCGIAGFIGFNNEDLIRRMTKVIGHRGPDDEGYYKERLVHLGHKRLSIIDVSGGRQPLFNEDATIVTICNGEIYNYKELKESLLQKGHKFSTNSDNEVLNHLYEEYGVNFITKLNGMFAFALWDKNKKTLMLARDRIGIKPLYYSLENDRIFFASEIKSLLCYEGIQNRIRLSPAGVIQYFKLRYTANPESIIRGIYKLEPGTFLLKKNGRKTQDHMLLGLTYKEE